MADLERRSPKGWGKYKKLDKGWVDYVEKQILADMLKTFPTSKGMTQKAVAQLLVNNGWIETIQRHTWRSARAAGLDVTYEAFKNDLLKQRLASGKVINSWKNSYVREMAKKMTKSIKSKAAKLNKTIASIEKGDSVNVLSKALKSVKSSSKGIKTKLAVLKSSNSLTEVQKKKRYTEVATYIVNDIKEVQYKAVVVSTTSKVNTYQGKRIAQDQFQRASNKELKKVAKKGVIAVKGKPNAVLVGIWRLSPTHTTHYYSGGEDPCEVHASHDAGYGKGSHVGDIPIPVDDSHYGCACSLELVVMKKK